MERAKKSNVEQDVLDWASSVKECERCHLIKKLYLYENKDEYTVLCKYCGEALSEKKSGKKLVVQKPDKKAPIRKAKVKKNPKTETYKQATARLLTGLKNAGWETKEYLKVPHATLQPTQKYGHVLRLWFKPQAIWLGISTNMVDSHSTFLDMRTTTVEQLIQYATKKR